MKEGGRESAVGEVGGGGLTGGSGAQDEGRWLMSVEWGQSGPWWRRLGGALCAGSVPL